MTMTLATSATGESVMAISAGPPPVGERPRYRTLSEWRESIADFEAVVREPPPLDHRRIYDKVNAVPRGTTAKAERDAAEDESAPKPMEIDPVAIYRTFNNPAKRDG